MKNKRTFVVLIAIFVLLLTAISIYFIKTIITPPADYGAPSEESSKEEISKPIENEGEENIFSEEEVEGEPSEAIQRITNFSADKTTIMAGTETTRLSWSGVGISYYELMIICEEMAAPNMTLLNGALFPCGHPRSVLTNEVNIGFQANAFGEAKFELRAYREDGGVVDIKRVSVAAGGF